MAASYIGCMTVLKAHFDGKVLVPDEAVDLPVNCPLEVQVRPIKPVAQITENPLEKLARLARQVPLGSNPPADFATQHDHYRYGSPKKP